MRHTMRETMRHTMRQTMKVTLRRVRATIVVVVNLKVLRILSVCSQLYVCSMQGACAILYCHLWPARFYDVFPHYLTNAKIFGKNLLKITFWFFLQRLIETFLIVRRTERDMIKNVYSSSCEILVILVRFEWNLSYFDRFSKNAQNTKFHENPSSERRMGIRADRQTWRR
jgi:hypothetical protein